MANSTINILERLGTILEIPDLGGEDWDLMFANPDRVVDFCAVYEHGSLSAAEKTALMQLIVASYDRYLSERTLDGAIEARVLSLLEHDFTLHRPTIEYWARAMFSDQEKCWAVTPTMRKMLLNRSGEA